MTEARKAAEADIRAYLKEVGKSYIFISVTQLVKLRIYKEECQ